MDENNIRFICEESVLDDKVTAGEDAVETLKKCSEQRDNGKHCLLTGLNFYSYPQSL